MYLARIPGAPKSAFFVTIIATSRGRLVIEGQLPPECEASPDFPDEEFDAGHGYRETAGAVYVEPDDVYLEWSKVSIPDTFPEDLAA